MSTVVSIFVSVSVTIAVVMWCLCLVISARKSCLSKLAKPCQLFASAALDFEGQESCARLKPNRASMRISANDRLGHIDWGALRGNRVAERQVDKMI